MTHRPQPRRLALVLGIAAAVVALDQLSKTWAEHHLADGSIHIVWTLQLKLEMNPGIAFSLGQGSTGLVTAAAVVILGLVAVFVWRTSGTALGVAFGLIAGGAVGNLSDRFLRQHGGQVIDFIDLRWWPVFNVADAAITCGVVLAVLLGARTDRGVPRLPSAQP